MTVEIVVDGYVYRGWKTAKITRSLETAAAGFSVDVSERYPNEGEHLLIKPGQSVKVYATTDTRRDLLITGIIDRVQLSYDGQSHTRSISGRSLTSKIIDSSVLHPTGQFRKQTISQIAQALCAPYGITVIVRGDTGAAIDNFQCEQSDTVFTAIERLAWLRKMTVTDTPAGELLLSNILDRKTNTALQCVAGGNSNNILSASGGFDNSQRFETIIVRSQSKTTDETFGKDANQIEAKATDVVKNGKTLIKSLNGDGNAKDAQEQADWEVAARKGKSTDISYTVSGWRQANGDLWECASCLIKDDFFNLDTELFITQVEFSLAADGTKTFLKLQPQEALTPAKALRKGKFDHDGEGGEGVGLWDDIHKDISASRAAKAKGEKK